MDLCLEISPNERSNQEQASAERFQHLPFAAFLRKCSQRYTLKTLNSVRGSKFSVLWSRLLL